MSKKNITIFCSILLIMLVGLFYIFNDNSTNLANNNNEINFSANLGNDSKYEYEITKNADYVATSIDDLYKTVDLVFIGTKNNDNKTFVGTNGLIITEANYNVKTVLKGSYNTSTININYYGGSVSLEEYIKNLSKEQIQKKGLDKYNSKDRQTKLIGYKITDKSILTQVDSNEYLIFVNHDQENNIYFVVADAYGMRQIDQNKNVYNLDTKSFEKFNF